MRLDDTLTRATLGVVESQLDLYVARAPAARRTRWRRKRHLPGSVAQSVHEGVAESAIAGEERLFQSRREGR